MIDVTKKSALALTGAVALASAGFALGSQSGDGSADAAGASTGATTTAPAPPRPPAFRGPGDIASKLGVSQSKLRDALEQVRQDLGDDGPQSHDEALAKALGISVDKLEAAEEQVRKQQRDAFVTALAKALGISEDKVRAALPEPPAGGPAFRGPGGPGGPGFGRHHPR
jgi:hypothetical protein